ncbi:MAG: VanZ family protein, partial [Burkholderiales bacterium PBB5]
MTGIRAQGLAWLAWLAFVVYGSLLPFDFQPLTLEAALEAFRHIPFLQLGIESRADWVANGVLYLPVGLLGVLALGPGTGRRGWVPALTVPVVFAAGSLLAVAVEFAQLYFPPRTVSQNDILAECIGTALGAGVAPLLAPWVARFAAAMRERAGAFAPRLLELYACSYLLLSLFPFDLLLTGDEWLAKLASDQCGWWLAEATRQRGWLAAVLLGAEVVLAMPFGVLLALRRRAPGSAVGAAVAVGVLLGMAVEGAQLAVASG